MAKVTQVPARLTPALSGVASLEQNAELNEGTAVHSNSAADEEGHVHSNAMFDAVPPLA